MYIIVKFIPALNEWLPLPRCFDSRAAADAFAATLTDGRYRVAAQAVRA